MPTIPSLPAYLPSLLGAAAVAALLVPLTARRQSTPGFAAFRVVVALAFLWCVSSYLEGVATTLEGKLLWSRLRLTAVAALPPLWLLFAVTATRRRSAPLVLGLPFLAPAATLALIWGDGGEPLVWSQVSMPDDPTALLRFEYGPWFWGAVIGYGVLLVLLGDVVLLAALRVAESAQRRGLLAAVSASLIPLALYLLHVTDRSPWAGADLTPPGFAVSGAILAWSLHRHRLFHLAPTAFRRVMESIPDCLVVVDSRQRVVFANPAAGLLLGGESRELVGQEISKLWPGWAEMISRSSRRQPRVIELPGGSGKMREIEVRVLPLGEGGEDGHVLLGQDVSERRSFERRIEEMAYNDPLTGLPNRRSLLEFARKVLSMSRREQSETALVFLDLQRFKEINDALGHPVGDTVLKSVSDRLATVTRTENMLARLGGDEFAAILQHCGPEGALGAARRMLEAIEEPFVVEGTPLHLSATAGIAIYPQHGDTVSDLLRHADMAMYQARREGHATCVFDSEDEALTAEHLRLESDLRSALGGTGLFLEYQPIVDAVTNATVAVEALLRWQHPQRGRMMPDDFLPLARRRALISPLDRFAMRQALGDLAGHDFDIAVNVAGSTLVEEGLADYVAEQLQEHGVDARRLILEITENELVLPERARPVINAIRALGVRIATDDFGSGFSSLTYLRTLPLDVVKVDRSLVESIGHGVEDEAILSAILRVAQSLSLAVVAEGVERTEQRDWLNQHTCGMLQGYLFARPGTIEQLARPLRGDPEAGGE